MTQISLIDKLYTAPKDGNGISQQTSLFLASDNKSITEFSSEDGWSDTFPTPTEQKPYVWKCVRTVYTQSGTTYSTPELITTFQSGCNPNLLDNAAFVDTDHMDAWTTQSVYGVVSGQSAPTDKGGIDTLDKVEGRHCYSDTCKAGGDTVNYKEVLRQVVYSSDESGRRKLENSKWYTLSFWAKGWQNVCTINQTSNKYGFASRTCYLFAGRTYRLRLTGLVSSDALAKGHTLRMYVFPSGWASHGSVEIASSTSVSAEGTFTPSTTGTYNIVFYMYDKGYNDGTNTDRTGTVTVTDYAISDTGRDLVIHLYPGIVDENVKPIIDGVETANNLVAVGQRFSLSSSWEKHTITFKTKDSFSSDRDNEVYFRFDSAVNAECYRSLKICMPKLEAGMFATGFIDTYEDVRGKLGPLAFLSGEWSESVTYTRSDELTPIVRHSAKYWYQSKNGDSLGDEPTDYSTVWIMAQAFDIILAKIVMAAFGKIASAIFCGDFMFSQYGTHNDVEVNESSSETERSTAYKDFDASNPDSGAFVPNLYINFLTGLVRSVKMKAYDMEAHGGTFDDVTVTGAINGNSGYFGDLAIVSSSDGSYLESKSISYKEQSVTSESDGVVNGTLYTSAKGGLYTLGSGITRVYFPSKPLGGTFLFLHNKTDSSIEVVQGIGTFVGEEISSFSLEAGHVLVAFAVGHGYSRVNKYLRLKY